MRRICLLACLLFLALECLAASSRFDLIIRNGRIVDGNGNPWFAADLGISNGSIVAIGKLADREARRIIDAKGRVVAPGFIDMMGAGGDAANDENKLRQGITTAMYGEGGSLAPSKGPEPGTRKKSEWRTFREYFLFAETQPQTINTVESVGATRIRQIVLGQGDVAPTLEQLEQMKAYVDQAMRDGVVGLTSALGYTPAIYAKTEELIELAKVAARYGGVYFSHIRNESAGLLEAIDEVIRIGREARIPVHIFHLKAAGQANWPLMIPALRKIQQARDAGLDITTDIYPYTRNQIGLGAFIPPRRLEQGNLGQFLAALSDPKFRAELRAEIETTSDWENWYLNVGRNWDNVWVVYIGKRTDPRFLGKSIQEIAGMTNTDPWQVFFDLFGDTTGVSALVMDEEQKREALIAPFVMFGCDAVSAHPRGFGTFPRILAKYVRDEHVLTVEEAVRKMTSLPANRLRLWDRGHISLGMVADLVIFDPNKVQDIATYEKPTQLSVGMDYVLIGGQAVIDDGKMTDLRPGRILKNRSTS
jgi:N-acyl-D-aspartate/D-glutamate deacylase